jgi:hypothetical protein
MRMFVRSTRCMSTFSTWPMRCRRESSSSFRANSRDRDLTQWKAKQTAWPSDPPDADRHAVRTLYRGRASGCSTRFQSSSSWSDSLADAQSQVNAIASSSPRCTEVSALIRLADPRPALVVARRLASAAPAASLESAGAYWDRVESVARRSPHVSNHVRSAARDHPVRSLGISRSIVSSL